MVAYLEKTEGNAQFHKIVDFLSRSSIFYALTVSPNVSTSLIEQFWNSAVSQTVNNGHAQAKEILILKSLIRSRVKKCWDLVSVAVGVGSSGLILGGILTNMRFVKQQTLEAGCISVLWGRLFKDNVSRQLLKWLRGKRYPLAKETLKRMLALRLIVDSESEAVFDLLRFIQKQINEFGSHDGSEKDL
ncbi:hypothetical protein Tco_0252292 [Tanacetum coccineum]